MNLPIIPTRIRLLEVPSGSIDLEPGGDGLYLQFNCDCLDALPYCRARCCSIRGIQLGLDETLSGKFDLVSGENDIPEIRRRADGYCVYNQLGTCLCSVYEHRPETCQGFHCSRGVGMRGWRLELYRHADED